MPLDQVDVDKMDEDDIEETEMSFLDHLEELRWHLVRSVLSIVVFGIITFLAKDFVFKSVILAPKEKTFATSGNRTRVSTVAGSYSTTRPTLLSTFFTTTNLLYINPI